MEVWDAFLESKARDKVDLHPSYSLADSLRAAARLFLERSSLAEKPLGAVRALYYPGYVDESTDYVYRDFVDRLAPSDLDIPRRGSMSYINDWAKQKILEKPPSPQEYKPGADPYEIAITVLLILPFGLSAWVMKNDRSGE